MKSLRNMGNPEFSFARTAFNLIAERGDDPERIRREAEETVRRQREAAEYQEKMQRKLTECPGFMGADLPAGPGCKGTVVVQPGLVREANDWLRKRFAVSESMELSEADGIVLQIIARRKSVTRGERRVKVSFGQPQQFELPLITTEATNAA